MKKTKATTQDKPQRLPRRLDPNYMRNPITGRYIKRTSKIAKGLLADAYLQLDNGDRGKVIAQGTRQELTIMKTKLEDSQAIDLHDQQLKIKGDKLFKVRRRMTRADTCEHIQKHSIGAALDNKELMASGLSNEQITGLLMKVCDARVLGVNIDLEREVRAIQMLNSQPLPAGAVKKIHDAVSDEVPPDPPKLVRQVGEHKKARQQRRRKYKVLAPPPTTTDADTDMTEFSELSD